MKKSNKRKFIKSLAKVSIVAIGVVTTSILATAIYNLKDVEFVD